MSEHHAKIAWKLDTDSFDYKTYNREHHWEFQGGETIRASAAPAFLGKPEFVDPEEALVAALSACHMLTFLAIASMKKFIIESYDDAAVGYMEKNEAGKSAITRVVLRPDIVFSGDNLPSQEDLGWMHEKAHKECFIANSVTTAITVEAS